MSKYRDWYIAKPDTIRGQEPRIRNTMPTIRNNNTGKEVAIFTNYSTDDALLACVAPELLEALESLIDTFDPDKQVMYEFARPQIEKAREAVNRCTITDTTILDGLKGVYGKFLPPNAAYPETEIGRSELLEALKRSVNTLEAYAKDAGEHDDPTVRDIRAVINKARGV